MPVIEITQLMNACAEGRAEDVEEFINSGGTINCHDERGHTPLMVAASAGHVIVAKILLKHGACINTYTNKYMDSALTIACYKGHLEMVHFLLSAGANKDHKTYKQHTALLEAIAGGFVEVVIFLLDSGMPVNMATDCFESPLTLAACCGHTDIALLLIDRGANVEELNEEGNTPFIEAANNGHIDMMSFLLSKGANINVQNQWTGETALTGACGRGLLETAKFLINNGAILELSELTPLMNASLGGHLDLVKYLVECGANIYAQTASADTALTFAFENGYTDVADFLRNLSMT